MTVQLGSLAWEQGAMIRGGRAYAESINDDGERCIDLVKLGRGLDGHGIEPTFVTLPEDQLVVTEGPNVFALAEVFRGVCKALGTTDYAKDPPRARFLFGVASRLFSILETLEREGVRA